MKEISEEATVTTLPKGYRAYKIKGVEQTIIAKKGGPSSEEVKVKGSYQELRNNQKEFAVASMMAKVLRSSLSEGMAEICETYVSGKLTAQFRNLAKQEQGQTGTRPMCISKHGHLLNGFEFNPEAPYNKIFDAKYYVKPGSRLGQVILHFPAFVPEKVFDNPEEATNFKINARLVALSDFKFDAHSGSYQPLNEELHGCYSSYESPMLPLMRIPTEPMTAQVSLSNVSEMSKDIGFFLVMAVSFYRYDKGQFTHLARHSGMHIHKVY
ncbi:MAG: hypothetical protein OEY56_03700 [Cyclobacteriaceae bacterium]|nr:hypothetical protein [Cyclobacteriaceae bacterium]